MHFSKWSDVDYKILVKIPDGVDKISDADGVKLMEFMKKGHKEEAFELFSKYKRFKYDSVVFDRRNQRLEKID